MTGKKREGGGGGGALVGYSRFSTDRAQHEGKSAMFLVCACTRALKVIPLK